MGGLEIFWHLFFGVSKICAFKFVGSLEKLNLRTVAGKCKIVGTVIAIGGAMILTFFKSIEIGKGSIHFTLLHHHSGHMASPQSSSGVKTLLGAVCALGSSCTFALLLIIQVLSFLLEWFISICYIPFYKSSWFFKLIKLNKQLNVSNLAYLFSIFWHVTRKYILINVSVYVI